MARMTMNHGISALRGSLLVMAALAACSSSEPLSETGHDAGGGSLAGASGSGPGGSSGGDSGPGGSTHARGSSAGGVTGSAGQSASGGALAGRTGLAGSSGSIPGPSGGKLPDAGAGSGGSEATGQDAAVSSDAAPDGPRSDASSPDLSSPEVSRDTGRTDALSPAAQQYLTTFAAPYCSRLATCCAQGGFPTPAPGACEAHELGFAKYLDDGSEVMDPTTIQTILTQLQNSCDQPSYILLASTTKGTRAPGEPCDAVDQCASDPGLCLRGKCMAPPRGKAGDGCAVTCDDYTTCRWATSGGKSPYAVCYEADGLRCDRESQACVALKAVGATCADFTECGAHATCTNGICVAMAKLGEDCSRNSCDHGLQCGNGTGAANTCQKLSIAWSGSCSP